MSELLKDHKNYIIFKYFQDICRIPHGSGNTTLIRDYIISIAKDHELEYVADSFGNVIVIRNASEGVNSPSLMLQSHMDMVCEKRSDSDHNFETDPLDIYIEDGFIKARGTTLGGDDGIGVAYMLALLTDPDYTGPRIDCVFTTDEEVGMTGADSLDLSRYRAKRLINLDSENEGVLTVGCAGGIKVSTSLPVEFGEVDGFQTDIVISGLRGGHSGDEINKGRGNAIQLLSRFLIFIRNAGCEFALISFNGGEKDNAIPREASASIVVSSSPTSIRDLAAEYKKIILAEYSSVDPNVSIDIFEARGGSSHHSVTDKCFESLILMTYSVPNGVIAMSRHINDLPETSTNLGVIRTTADSIECKYLLRSSLSSRKEELLERMLLIFRTAGAKVTCSGNYPAWEYTSDSSLRNSMASLWEKMYGKAPEITAIHGGLECGIIHSKCPDMDIVSIGPDILDIHTPDERLDIESASRVYDFLVRFLRECN